MPWASVLGRLSASSRQTGAFCDPAGNVFGVYYHGGH
jgi:hypothetical protein